MKKKELTNLLKVLGKKKQFNFLFVYDYWIYAMRINDDGNVIIRVKTKFKDNFKIDVDYLREQLVNFYGNEIEFEECSFEKLNDDDLFYLDLASKLLNDSFKLHNDFKDNPYIYGLDLKDFKVALNCFKKGFNLFRLEEGYYKLHSFCGNVEAFLPLIIK